jgi:predicted DNA-binding transcriptional regulator AlpA
VPDARPPCPDAATPLSPATAVEPLLIDRRELARLLSVGVATLDRMRAAGRIPPPLTFSSGCVRWRLDEVRAWLDAGAPGAAVWAARRDAQRSGRR